MNQVVVKQEKSGYQIVEAYKSLRTNLEFLSSAGNCKTILITSSVPEEGKTNVAVNLAMTIAASGKRVVLVDCDLRKATISRYLRIPRNHAGLTNVITSKDEGALAAALVRVKDSGITVLAAGTIPPNPSELLSSDRMKGFVESCADYYDYVIIDTPPINTVADAQIISTFVDGVVLVARSGNTTADELNAATAAVRRAGGNLCGVVLNGLNMKSVKYASKYKYGDKYGYRYSYSESYGTK